MKKLLLIAGIAVVTFYIWHDPRYGNTSFWWNPDGSTYIYFHAPPTPRPGPTPYPVIVHPVIRPAATPAPGTGRPPAI